jgi:signal transduction histidine kinase
MGDSNAKRFGAGLNHSEEETVLQLRKQVERMQQQIEFLQKEKAQLEISLEAVTEHADLIEAQLLEAQETLEAKVAERTRELAHNNEMLQSEIEERLYVEAQLRHSKESAEQARMQAEMANRAKSAFLANMSHELRTPLNAIIGYSDILHEEAEENGHDDYIADIAKIQGAGKHLLGLISDILDISKIEAGKMNLYMEMFPVENVLNDVVDTLRPMIKKRNNSLQVEWLFPLGDIYSDMTKVRQIFFNLLSNAVKFTENGRISLKAGREQREDGDWFICCIADQGIGMSEAQLKKLFQPFSQADDSTTRKYGGTGLGLAITRSFVELMGGKVIVTSELGQGSCFEIRLPASPPPG